VVLVAVAGCSSGASKQVSSGPTTTTEADEAGSESLVGADATTLPSAFPQPPAATCGVERQTVKTGEDPDADKVNQTVVKTTIAELDALGAPVMPTARVAPVEETVYQLTATLLGFKQESDSDYHLVLKDASGQTMIVEIPAPNCVTGGPFKGPIGIARSAFDARFHPGRGFQSASVMVTITGVGFFDRIHGQTGVAPNGIELHPVLTVAFG